MPPSEVPPRDVPPDASGDARDARLRRYWGRYNRPYVGCGFLWTAGLLLLIYWLLSLFFPSLVPSVY